jgi:aromatic ring-opening dioxygenase catalytic subunit (LigB family)
MTRRELATGRVVEKVSIVTHALALAETPRRACSPLHVVPPVAVPAERQPVAFVSHGGGPWPFVDLGFGTRGEAVGLASYLRRLRRLPKAPPRAVLVISAHWEAPLFTVTSGASPPMLFDYEGFPSKSYALRWPAPGDPGLAAEVRDLASGVGHRMGEDGARGFDHGTFVVMKLAYPAATIPTVQLSLKRGTDPAEHLALGQALAPLRDRGVFIVGSGMSSNNLHAAGPRAAASSRDFDAWLRDAAVTDVERRNRRLERWFEAPGARDAHPRGVEHLLPLLVVAGAAMSDAGRVAYGGTFGGITLSAYEFG